MKAYYKLLIVTLLIATACSPSYVGTSAFQDDIYYVPGKKSLIDKEMAVYTTEPVRQEPIIEQTQKAEPTTKATFGDDRSFQQVQEEYNQMLNDDSVGPIDTTYYNDEQGYFIGEFNGTDSDLDDIDRLREWYPQGFGYYDNSGYNMAMWLAGDSDWNVYVEGDKVWWTPSWTNYNNYNSYRFSPVRYGRQFAYNYPSYGSSFGFGFGIGNGFYDDFYWGSSFGWGNSYYGNYYNYGYGSPYYGYNNYNRGYYGGNYGYTNHSRNYYGHRTSVGSKTGTNKTYTKRSAATNTQSTARRVNRSAVNTKSGTTTRRSAVTNQNAVRRSTAAQKYGTRNSRSSYSNRVGTNTRRTNTTGTTTRYGTQSRSSYQGTKAGTTTRRTSNYTKPSSSSRPSYNQSGTRRSSTIRSTGTRSSRYSKVKSTPTYRKSSTRSSSSSYSPSRSSSSRSSGAVRSSSSSSRSSSGTSRSTKSTTTRRR